MRTRVSYTYYINIFWADGKKTVGVELTERAATERARRSREIASVIRVEVERRSRVTEVSA